MNEQLTKAERELLMCIPELEEGTVIGKYNMSFDEALDSLLEGSNLYDADTLYSLKLMGLINDNNHLTREGRVYVDNQIIKEENEYIEAERDRKNKRNEHIASIVSAVIGSTVGAALNKVMGGGNQ